jgi:YD repeat-containing protein
VLPGFLLAAAALAGTVNYTYDDAGRLAKVDYGDGRAISYTYDNSGNLLRREVTAPAPAAAPSPPSGDNIQPSKPAPARRRKPAAGAKK